MHLKTYGGVELAPTVLLLPSTPSWWYLEMIFWSLYDSIYFSSYSQHSCEMVQWNVKESQFNQAMMATRWIFLRNRPFHSSMFSDRRNSPFFTNSIVVQIDPIHASAQFAVTPCMQFCSSPKPCAHHNDRQVIEIPLAILNCKASSFTHSRQNHASNLASKRGVEILKKEITASWIVNHF